MVNKSISPMPVVGGRKKRRVNQPSMKNTSPDSSIISGNAPGYLLNPSAQSTWRLYNAAYPAGLAMSTPLVSVAKHYSTFKFLPGTKVRWEPACSFNTSGRVFCGWTDNPEVMATLSTAATPSALGNFLQNMGTFQSFPVWQETDINFPTRLRRKRYDINQDLNNTNVDQLDRCAQQGFFAVVVGGNLLGTDSYGAMWYHDKVDVEGLQPSLT